MPMKNADLPADLHDFLPPRLFDAHAHLYREADLRLERPLTCSVGPEATPAVWRERVGRLAGAERLAGGLFFPFPTPGGDLAAANAWLLRQMAGEPDSRALFLIAPDVPPAEELCRHPAFAGFKPYHHFAAGKPTWSAVPDQFVPAWAWPAADARGAVIMLHLVRGRALADPENQRYIREHAARYPRAQLVLAHAGRGFNYRHTRQGLAALRGLENIWFDTSGICEAPALTAILDQFGPRKLLWGTDFPVSEIEGRAVALGEGFLWADRSVIDFEKLPADCRPATVGVEALRALRQAAEDFGLNAADLEDVFYNNARRLLGLAPADGQQTAEMYRRAKRLIPAGTQLLSKRPEMFAPDQWPAYFREARGCETWDLDGRHYYDLSSNGIGSCLLGFRDPEVTRAVRRRLNLGAMSSLNPPEEVELAQTLLRLHPWAESARFARSGGEIAAVAVRIARATTRRSLVAVCGYHGWHDWYLAANLGASSALDGHLLPGLDPLGVPRELQGTTLAFRYGDAAALEKIAAEHGGRLAAVVMEPCRYHPPAPGFLEAVRQTAQRCGALLIFDEITIGWRLASGGAHLRFGVNPDMAIFAKALGNGHPIAAVIGTDAAMAGAHTSFISSTYWTESIGPAAALATIARLEALPVREHVERIGARIVKIWQDAGAAHNLPVHTGNGFNCILHLRFEHAESEVLRTLYTQEMLKRGFLAGAGVFPTWAHTDAIIDRFALAVDEVFAELSRSLRAGKVRESLRGPVAHSGFRRLL